MIIGDTVNNFSATIDLTKCATDFVLDQCDGRCFACLDRGFMAGSVPLNQGRFAMPLPSVTRTDTCGGVTSGSANVIVVGPNAGGSMSSYDLHSGNPAMSGTMVAKP